GFASLLFVGPAMLIGMSRALLRGSEYFISWVVIFLATQNLGALVGSSLFGTIQTVREKYHSSILVQQVTLQNPTDAGSFATRTQRLSLVIQDPVLRSAEGTALIAQRVAREANLLA